MHRYECGLVTGTGVVEWCITCAECGSARLGGCDLVLILFFLCSSYVLFLVHISSSRSWTLFLALFFGDLGSIGGMFRFSVRIVQVRMEDEH